MGGLHAVGAGKRVRTVRESACQCPLEWNKGSSRKRVGVSVPDGAEKGFEQKEGRCVSARWSGKRVRAVRGRKSQCPMERKKGSSRRESAGQSPLEREKGSGGKREEVSMPVGAEKGFGRKERGSVSAR